MSTATRIRSPHGYPVEPIRYINTSDLLKLFERLKEDKYLADVDDALTVLRILENPEKGNPWPDPDFDHFDWYMMILNDKATK